MKTRAAATDAHASPRWAYGGRGHRDALPNAPALEVQRLQARYARCERPAIHGVQFVVERGRRAALVGPNGAGKSTILKCIAGLLKPESGVIRLFGNRVGDCHHRTAYLPQRTDLDWRFPLSVSQLVMTGRYVHLGWFRRPAAADRRHVDAALERLGLKALADRQISELSGGQQQRALLARALAQQSDLFLFDEPLNAVDQPTRDILHDVLNEHAERGGSVLAATHDLSNLADAFDFVISVQDGQAAPAEISECLSVPIASLQRCAAP
ncbi:MAG: metal ABC transporter ATP-binding protein [Pirellulales bacterium]